MFNSGVSSADEAREGEGEEEKSELWKETHGNRMGNGRIRNPSLYLGLPSQLIKCKSGSTASEARCNCLQRCCARNVAGGWIQDQLCDS